MTQTTAREAPALSAVLVVGPRRARSQRALNALCVQTAIDAIEIVVVDLAPPEMPRLMAKAGVRLSYVSRPSTETLSEARSEALRHVHSPVVAFVEDHCVAARNWAEVLIETHKGPWAAVGYAFTNLNPEGYLSRSALVNDYGPWISPARRGEVRFLPAQNISYKRSALAPFGSAITRLLTPDFTLHEELRAQGAPMFLEANAIVAHENFTYFRGEWWGHFIYMRLLSARRADEQGWSRARRVAYGFGVLAGAPVIAMWRLYGQLSGRRVLVRGFLAALPLCIAMRLSSAAGESIGYFFGEGDAEREVHYWELVAERNEP